MGGKNNDCVLRLPSENTRSRHPDGEVEQRKNSQISAWKIQSPVAAKLERVQIDIATDVRDKCNRGQHQERKNSCAGLGIPICRRLLISAEKMAGRIKCDSHDRVIQSPWQTRPGPIVEMVFFFVLVFLL